MGASAAAYTTFSFFGSSDIELSPKLLKSVFFSPWEGSGRNTSKLDIFFLLNFKKHCSNYTQLMDNK